MSGKLAATFHGAGGFLGALLVGIPIGAYAARRFLAVNGPAKPYDQAGAITTSLTNLRMANA